MTARRLFIAAAVLLSASTLARALNAQQAALPDARALIATHDSLVGGPSAYASHRSMRTIGTFNFPLAGISAPLEVIKVRPDRFLVRISIANFGEVMQGYDGETAWAMQPNSGPQILEGLAASRMIEQASFTGELHDLSRFSSVETVADTTFEGVRVYKVKLTRPTGDIVFEYFNPATGLSAGGSSQVVTPDGPVENITIFGDYRQFGALRLASRVIQRQPGTETVLQIVAIEFDTLDSSATVAPEAVRALRRPPTTTPPTQP
jgi:hypothetical protein